MHWIFHAVRLHRHIFYEISLLLQSSEWFSWFSLRLLLNDCLNFFFVLWCSFFYWSAIFMHRILRFPRIISIRHRKSIWICTTSRWWITIYSFDISRTTSSISCCIDKLRLLRIGISWQIAWRIWFYGILRELPIISLDHCLLAHYKLLNN